MANYGIMAGTVGGILAWRFCRRCAYMANYRLLAGTVGGVQSLVGELAWRFVL
jgi:hypothetical protein